MNNNLTCFFRILLYLGTQLMTPKREQYWPEKEDMKKTVGHMEIIWRDEEPIRPEFSHQKFEIANKKEGKQRLL